MHNHERVTVTPRRVKKGEKMEVRYRGLLSENGADRVWCHYGYDGWKNKATVPMENLPDGSFSCKIPANCQREINSCFSVTRS